jgi:alpha,alpha-trehalase
MSEPPIRCEELAGGAPIVELALSSNPRPAEIDPQGFHSPVESYIPRSWEMLTRSMSEYVSVMDEKVASKPILYLPADVTVPADAVELYDRCRVQVRSLPRVIERMGDVKPEDLPAPGLLYLPHPYIVPGGRFNEMYGWDSYFIVLGLISSGRHELARGMAENLLFEIRCYGAVLNANRTYCLTRSHPPFLTATIRAVYDCEECFSDRDTGIVWLGAAYKLAAKYYAIWTESRHLAGNTGLTRYFDMDTGPVPELADDSTYFFDVIEWLLAHPRQDPGYLIEDCRLNDLNVASQEASTGCNPRAGALCDRAQVSGRCLADDFYIGDRAMRESGFDSSFRFGPFCGMTHHFAPVCLNSLLFRYECDMAGFARELQLPSDALNWDALAERRAESTQRYLWQKDEGLFQDYNFISGQSSRYSYLSTFYPMWAGLASKEQSESLRTNLSLFERSGGLAMSANASGMQWDEPYGWAPCHLIVAEGMRSYGYFDDARRIARAFMDTVDHGFKDDGTIREKYDVARRGAEVHVTAGYKENAIGFGWTNGVYLKMRELLSEIGE